MTEPEPLQQVDRTFVLWRRRKFIYFGGCDYFRLSSHPAVIQAMHDGLDRYGLNVAASRLTTGNHPLYAKLESRLARFFNAPDALLVSNGYSANAVAAQALRADRSLVLCDEKSHVSLRDAIRFFDCQVIMFKHRDPRDLTRALASARRRAARPVLLTDAVFGHDGAIAPLPDYLKILPSNARVLLDDAHGAGIRPLPVPRKQIIQTITLSKAFGVYGGAILCDSAFREKILAASPMMAGSTPLPLPLAAAAYASLGIVSTNHGLHHRLEKNTAWLKTKLRQHGLPILPSPAPIITIQPSSPRRTAEIHRRLIAHDIFPSFIRYPGGPSQGAFRFAISSEHTQSQLNALADALAGA